MTALAAEIHKMFEEGERMPESTGECQDSQSMGAIESTIRWWRGKFRSLRSELETAYGRQIHPQMAVWHYLVTWAAQAKWSTKGKWYRSERRYS